MFKKIVLYLLLTYAFIGFVATPLVLKSQLVKIVAKETNAKLSVGHIYFNPFLFRLELSALQLNSLDNKKLVYLDSLLIDIEPHSLIKKAIHIKDITLKKPEIVVNYYKNKTINLLNILKPKKSTDINDSKASFLVPRIIIDNISIKKGDIFYEDFTLKDRFQFSLHKLGFNLKNIDTNDFNSSDAKLRFYTTLDDGGFIDLKSDIKGFKPFILDGVLDFEASKLYTEWRYIKEKLNLEVADGKISFHTHYKFNLEALNQTTIDNTDIYIKNLRIIPKGKDKDILNLKSLHIANLTAKPFSQKLHIDKILLNSLQVKSKRDTARNIDWLEYIKVKNNSDTTALQQKKSKSQTKPWDVVVDEIALQKISVDFEDNSVKPKVKSKVNELNIYAQAFTLTGEKPLTYQLDIDMNNKFRCNSTGNIKHKTLDIKSDIACHQFNLIHYRPYIDQIAKHELKKYNIKLIKGTVDLGAHVAVNNHNKHINILVNDANLSLSHFALNRHDKKERILDFKSFKIVGLALDTAKKHVNIKKSSLNLLNINTARYKNGKLNFEDLILPKTDNKKVKVSKNKKRLKQKPYSLQLKHFALNNAKVNFHDKALSPSVKNSLDKMQLDIYNISLSKKSWLNYSFFARVNKKGSIKSKGVLRHTPLKQRGTFELKDIGLTALNPYIQEKAFVTIDDGKLSLKTKTYYTLSKNSPDLRVNGSVNLKDFFVSDSRDKSSIMSLIDLKLKSSTFELNPNRLYIDEVDLTSFYVDAMIDENRQMNLSQLMKPTDKKKDLKKKYEEDKNSTKEVTFPIKILQINVSSGSARFADYSIPLKFQTNIHDLNGAIYSVSNIPGETSYIDISGDVDKYGATKLKGSINSANPKEYTDLNFNFKNLELNSLSGYSASFAGHEIDSGKLYLDLGYKISNSELLGKNSIIIKKIKLGREIKDENISVLPLGFVIGLLEDSDGIIDINMPVTGDLDKPDFKYGALIWKTLGNLITKAVTSPFRFLGSMMGLNGEDLEYAEFELGNTRILPTEREKLDNIAKMMIKRPKIKLLINPTYDAIKDKNALQQKKLVALVVKKSGIQNKKNHKSAMTIEMLESIYKDYRDDAKLTLLQKDLKKRYKDETYERAYLSALAKLCRSIQSVSKTELENLANNRVHVIKRYLIDEKYIHSSRVIFDKLKVITDTKENLMKLDLRVEVN